MTEPRDVAPDAGRPAALDEPVLDGDELRGANDGERVVDCGGLVMTIETARSCGLLPQQILGRRRTDVAVLEAYGHGDTVEAGVLRADVAAREVA